MKPNWFVALRCPEIPGLAEAVARPPEGVSLNPIVNVLIGVGLGDWVVDAIMLESSPAGRKTPIGTSTAIDWFTDSLSSLKVCGGGSLKTVAACFASEIVG